MTLFKVGLTCVLVGGLIGAITNMINGAISPQYFKIVMGWDFQNIWMASIAQGIFEGLLYGIIFSLIFTTGFAMITKGNATYNFALKQLLKVIILVFSCWLLGGLIAILLASLSPEFYIYHFYDVPEEKTEMLKYAWVGGSIWGGMIGGLLGAVFSVLIIKNSWNEKTLNE